MCERSIADFERACLVLLGNEQGKIRPDNHLISVLCDAVRLGREFVDSRTGRYHELLLAAKAVGTDDCHCDGRGCTICNLDYALNRLGDL